MSPVYTIQWALCLAPSGCQRLQGVGRHCLPLCVREEEAGCLMVQESADPKASPLPRTRPYSGVCQLAAYQNHLWSARTPNSWGSPRTQ